ncbi:MAG: hypothetical protein CVU05_09900 [Bacteroidetes bacterium HGW-Bacteroidetes-21]|nr:MAG: hypothetical protein CVU05_09900 [Bacteroidetes bacterium HGW-Bacteroidetes-21]
MPIAGQVLPPIHFNYNNNALSFKNVIYPGSGLYSDSLVTPFQKGEDPTKFFNRLHQVNYMSVENHIDLISLGYRWKDFYFDFHIAEKTEFRVSFPKDLMVLGWEGNAGQSLLGQEAFLSFLGATATHYREYAWGTSWKMNDKLTLGGTAKLLFGKANLYSKKTDLTFTTREDDFAYTINADMEVYSSQPIFDVLELYYDYEGDSIVYKDTTYDDVTAKQMIFNTKNPGTAIDLGASYKFNDKISFYASVLDIGFIKWKDNVNTFKLKGEYLWDGWHDIRPSLMQDSTLINETIDNYRDSVIHLFDPQYQETSYTQWLTPKFYLGGTYQFHEKLKVGMLLRGDVFQHRLHGGVTLSANSQLTKWFGTSVSYTIHNSSFNNVGLGLVFKIPWFQFYLVSDNVTSFIWPQATRNVNFRIGVNMLFGCDKKNSEAKLN